jgi:large subunit ribosomal protein L24e
MKRIAEIKQKRERAFWKHRMSVAHEKHKDARRRAKEKIYQREAVRDSLIAASKEDEEESQQSEVEMDALDSLDMVRPIKATSKLEPIKEKIFIKEKRKTKRSSALVAGDGRSMGMEID